MPMNPRILVVDDDGPARRLVKAVLASERMDVSEAESGEEALVKLHERVPDVVLLDLHMRGLGGMQVLERIKADLPSLPVVMLTGSHEVKDAVQAMQLGAFDYQTKPYNRDELILVVRRAVDTTRMQSELEEYRRGARDHAAAGLIAQMGTSLAIREVVDQVALVAASTFTVLIIGETGTGKELVAQAVHRLSDRRHRPFVALDCGAIPEALMESELFGHEKGAFTGAERRKEGRFRLAEGGTCLLDEIGNMPLGLQAKLLRVLESGEVQPVGADRATAMNVRFIAATNEDLESRAGVGAFRSDLYFRLAQYSIRLPPLRDRRDDIPAIAMRFAQEAATELRRPIETIVQGALDLLVAHDWPGNARQLRNVMRRAVLQTNGLAVRAETVRALLGDARRERPDTPPPSGASLREVAQRAATSAERHAIVEALRASRGNKAIAARALSTDYKTLHLKIKHLGISPRDFA